jgi:hypothetical protein
MPEHFCLDCQQARELTVHGRCATCNSEAVCLSDPPKYDGNYVESLIESVVKIQDKV